MAELPTASLINESNAFIIDATLMDTQQLLLRRCLELKRIRKDEIRGNLTPETSIRMIDLISGPFTVIQNIKLLQ